MFLDIGLGLLISLGVTSLYGVEPTLWIVLFSVACALLPDIDLLMPSLWPAEHDHRTILHYPITYVPVVLAISVVAGPLYGVIAAVGILAHLVHDTIGLGWGIPWLAPYRYTKFLVPRSILRADFGWFMRWEPEDEAALVAAYREPHWIRTNYLRPSLNAMIEYGTLMVGLVAVWMRG